MRSSRSLRGDSARSPSRRFCIPKFAERSELCGWLPDRPRSPATSPPACSWSSSAAGYQVRDRRGRARWPAPGRARAPSVAGHQVGGDRRRGRVRRHVSGRTRERRLATRSAAIAGAAKLTGMLVVKLAGWLRGWAARRARRGRRDPG